MKKRTMALCGAIAAALSAAPLATADLTLAEPSPGTAGMVNVWSASGATPGARVAFIFGQRAGETEIRVCPGTVIGITRPAVFAIVAANGDGEASVRRFVPRLASGQTVFFQAAEPQSCTVSNVVEFTFD